MDVDDAKALLELARTVGTRAIADDAEEWVARLDARRTDIEPAVHTLLATGDVAGALDLVGSLSIFWQDVGDVDRGRAITERLLEQVGDTEGSEALARAHLVVGELAFRQGDQDAATSYTSKAKDIAEATGSAQVAGRAELNLARIAFRDGDAARIFDHAERVLDSAHDDQRLRSGAIHMLGWAEYTAGHRDAAMARFEENAALRRGFGDRIGEASELANLGDLAIEGADLDRGASYLRSALEIPGVAENRYLGTSLLRSAGVLQILRGDGETGLDLIAASEALYERFGMTPDPGDDVTPGLRARAVDALGPRAKEIEARGRARTFEEAISMATAVC